MPLRKFSISAILLLALLLLLPGLMAQAAEAPGAPALLLWTPGEPLDISAETMRFESDSAHIVFENEVHLKQSGLDMRCRKLTLASDGQGRLKGFVAEGALSIKRAGLVISAMRAEYDHEARRLTLSGSPTVERNSDMVRGERIVIEFDSGALTVEKAQARVKLEQSAASDTAHE